MAEIDCNAHGKCNSNGICECNLGFESEAESTCSSCSPDYYGYPNCTCKLISFLKLMQMINNFTDCLAEENCNGHGVCNAAGQCDCLVAGLNATDNCRTCSKDFYNFPACSCIIKKKEGREPS